MKLYIIGNGFDLHHQIKSGYCDFKKFLENLRNHHSEIPLFLNFCDDFFPNSLWSDFETNLGLFDKDKYIKRYLRLCASSQNINQSTQNMIDNELVEFQQNLNYYFEEWITSLETEIDKICISNPPIKKVDINAYFLTFNYTNTLQKLYNVPVNRILHIHHPGRYDYTPIKAQQKRFILGHKENKLTGSINETDVEQWVREFINDNQKPVNEIIIDNNCFWRNLNNITEIIVLGFSFGKVDVPYLEQIVASVGNKHNVYWKIHCHTNDIEKQAKNVMLRLQVTGNIEYKDNIDDLLEN